MSQICQCHKVIYILQDQLNWISTIAKWRENIVSMLSQHIKIDIFGRCGQRKCGEKQDLSCYQNMNKTNKFYLSFENSICQVKKFFLQHFNSVSAGLCDWEVLQHPLLQRDTGGVQWSQHVSHSSSPQLYQRWRLQLSKRTGRVPDDGWEKSVIVRFLFLVERLLQASGGYGVVGESSWSSPLF